MAFIAPILFHIDSIYIAAYGRDPDAARFEPPSMKHPLGTGCMRGDIFSKVCSGAYYAFLHGLEWALIGMPILVIAAAILAIRKEPPQSADTLSSRYAKFVLLSACFDRHFLVDSYSVFIWYMVSSLERVVDSSLEVYILFWSCDFPSCLVECGA